MNRITTFVVYVALLVAGLIGITLSVPLQAPAVVLLGVAALCAGVGLVMKPGGDASAKWLLALVTVVIVYFAVRALMSPVRNLGVQDLMLILPAGILYLVAGFGLSGSSGAGIRQGLAWVVVLLLLLHTGAALMQLSGSDGYSLSRYFTSAVAASGDRVTGMYGYYGSFANFMVIAGLLCLSLGGWGRFGKVLRGVLFLLGCLALGLAVWSQSRSAAVSLVVSLVVLAALLIVSLAYQKAKVRRSGTVLISVLAAVGLLGGLAGGVWVFENRAQDSTEKASEMMFDSGVRMPFWSMATEQWADHPIVGAGSRSYSYLANKYWSPNLPTGEANPEFVHNEYLQLLADYGLIGLLLILSLLGWHLVLGVRRVRRLSKQVGEEGLKQGSNAMALTIAGVCGMVAMAVHIVFDFRTHLLANLLLLVCCATWVLPVVKSGSPSFAKATAGRLEVGGAGSRGGLRRWCLVLVLLALGVGALGLGGWQLWGGMPMLEAKIAKEDGAWSPEAVSSEKWIPVLEESVVRAPDFNRYQRLGTLYQLEANGLEGEAKESMLDRAAAAYEASIEHNPYNPVPWINLAAMYAWEKRYEKADYAFSKASGMAAARERWFRMHSRWASLQQQWADEQWRSGNMQAAEEHFLRAKELYLESYDHAYFYQNKQWVVEYTRLLIAYARFLDHQKRYADAELLFAEGREQVNWVNWQRDTKMNFYYGQHLYEYGRHVWYQRKPREAYQLMLKARAQLTQHQGMMKEDVEKGFAEQLGEVEKVIDFLKQTGVGE